MLICGIPVFRLSRESVAKEIDALLNQNMEIKCNQTLGRDFTIESLKRDGYKAIYAAIGAHHSKKLGIPGEDVEGVIPGIRFLKAYNLHGAEMARGKVGIIGGGDGAMDAARVAIRQRDVEEVTIYYRRTRSEMPAIKEEVEAALFEGIKIEFLVAPVGIKSKDGKLKAVVFQRNELSDRDETGRFRPVPIPGSEVEVLMDTLIAAISEEPDYEAMADLKLKGNRLVVNPESWVTSEEGVFGGGDATTGPSTVIGSVAAGKNAAVMIDRYLSGRQMRKLTFVALPTAYVPPVESEEEAEFTGRMPSCHISAAAREKNYNEVDLCPTEQMVLCEARRCLRCDLEFTRPQERETALPASEQGRGCA
jgi:NADH-quinone oxidoreductase subunit F